MFGEQGLYIIHIRKLFIHHSMIPARGWGVLFALPEHLLHFSTGVQVAKLHSLEESRMRGVNARVIVFYLAANRRGTRGVGTSASGRECIKARRSFIVLSNNLLSGFSA